MFSPGVGSDGMMRIRSGVSATKQAHPSAISMGFMPSAIGFGSQLSPSVR